MASKNARTTVEVLIAGAEIDSIVLQPRLVKTVQLLTVGHVTFEICA